MSELQKLKREKSKAELKGNWKDVAAICNYMGQLYSRSGNNEDALEVHQEELQICTSLNDQLGVAIANRRIGECYNDMGEYKKALKYCKKYLDLALSLGSQVEEQRAWATLGRTYYYIVENGNLQALDKAENAFLKSLELAQSLREVISTKEHAEMKAKLLLNVGLVYSKRENMSQCAESIKKAIFLAKKHGLSEDLHRCQYSLTNVYERHGNLTFALRLADETIASAKVLKDKVLICDSLLLKVQIMIALKDFQGAKVHCKKAYKIQSTEINDQIRAENYLKILHFVCKTETEIKILSEKEKDKRASLSEKIGDALAYLCCYKQAVQYYISALEDLIAIGKSNRRLTAIYFSIAQTYADDGQYEKALEYFQKEFDGNVGNNEEQCKTLLKIADIYEQKNDYDQLEFIYQKAITTAEESKNFKLQYQCVQYMKDLHEKNGNLIKAKEMEEKLESLKCYNTRSDADQSESECEEDTPNYFNEISLSDLSEYTDSDIEEEMQDAPKRRMKKRLDEKRNDVGETPLHRACIDGNLKFVKHLIEGGHIVNPRDNCGWIPLHEACNYGYYDIVQYLIEHGAFVNDNGGDLCEGVTPLHDAASCGHIDVMKLLIEKGASITACTNDGENVLDCLRKWRKRAHRDLSPEELDEILEFENELSNKLNCDGEKQFDPNLNEGTSSSDFPEMDYHERKNTDKRHRSPSISPTSNFKEGTYIMEDDMDIYSNPLLHDNIMQNDIDSPDIGCFEYQSVMSNLRKSAVSSKAPMPKQSVISNKPATALVDEENLVKDWLLDDINEQKHSYKRKRTCNYEAGVYSKTNDWGKIKKRRHSRMKQSKLNIKSYKKTDAKTDIQKQVEYSETVVNHEESSDENLPSSDIPTSKNIEKSNFCLKVRVENKLILIPVHNLDFTIEWLANEASKRYYNLVGIKPNLSLSTLDGAVLSLSDPIGLVLTNCEEVATTVESWEMPPLIQRYKEACEKFSMECHKVWLQKLQNTEISGEFSIENIQFSITMAKPILTAMCYQTNLRVLNIKSCSLGDEISTLLASSLITLNNLVMLGLRCCGLTSIGIQNVANICFADSLQTKSLQSLEKLDIAYNDVGSNCTSICSFLQNCSSLISLDVSGCSIINQTLQETMIPHLLKNKTNLQELYLSENKLGISGLSLLFSSLCVNQLRKLDLSRTTNKSDSNFGNLFSKYFSQTLLPLTYLSLRGCYLQNDDVISIAQTIPFCRSLQHLDLSANPNINISSFDYLVQQMIRNNIPLNCLHLASSLNWNYDDVSEDCLMLMCQLNKLTLTCNEKSEYYVTQLCEKWQTIHGRKALCIEGPGNFIEFKIHSEF